MTKFLYYLCSTVAAIFILTACGGGGGSSHSDDTGTIPSPSGPPAAIELSSQFNASEGSFTIIATVSDENGEAVNDGTTVVFSSTTGDISPSQAGTVAGMV
ncbi:MAG: hypothetical protein C0614_03730, partial [Desulfuromonas sp.]